MVLSDRVARHLALGVVLISALIMVYMLYELSWTKQDFASQLIEQSSQNIQSELNEFFLPVENMMMTLKQQYETGLTQDFDSVAHLWYFIPIIDQYSQISSIARADSRGYEFNIIPDSSEGHWLSREVNVDEWGMTEKWNRWSVQDGLSHLDYREQDLQFDPRARPWFTGALRAEGTSIHWTEPYLYMTDDLGITASIEWKSAPEDTLRRILALDVTLNDLTSFSQNLSLTENNQNFILTRRDKNIIGLPQGYSDFNSSELKDKLMSTPEEFGNRPLAELLTHPVGEMISFESQDKQWWGIQEVYSITSEHELLIAIIIPESDFSSAIDSTRNAMMGGFVLVLLLFSLLVRNHNKLRRVGFELNEKNNLINEQKQDLFAEVHHRVKNNLALMAAFLDIESMESENPEVKKMLTQNQRRISSMSAVHEILYMSDDMNRVRINDFIPEILNFSRSNSNEPTIEIKQDIQAVLINVNQALTYALLINELMSSILKSELVLKNDSEVSVQKTGNTLKTEIKIGSDFDHLKMNSNVEQQLIGVLLTQLDADLKTTEHEEFVQYTISFDLQDKKGITSHLKY